MSNGEGGSGGGVATPVGIGFLIADLAKKPRPGFSPFGISNSILRNTGMQATTQARIDQDIRLGNEPRPADVRRLSRLREQRARLDERQLRVLRQKRRVFKRLGFPALLTAAQLLAMAIARPRGQQIIARFRSPVFAPPPLPTLGTTIGGTDVPFTITPAVAEGFGDFFSTGLRVAERFLAPKPQQVQFDPRQQFDPRFQQASLAGPLLGGAGRLLQRPLVAGAAGGALGQGLLEGFENLFGGASTLDDAAAFTDPIPGSCRPKTHLKVNPCTGKSVWFTPRGRPLVFSGDLSACKRVDRVAKRLGKAMPKRHHHHRTAKR